MENSRVRVASRLLALGGLALMLLTGCESIREAAGITKEPPDEFAVVTKAPLVIPPDFNLKPPKPGAAPTNQISATTSAQVALYGTDPSIVAAGISGNFSQEEKIVLSLSGGATADRQIRQQVEADAKRMEPADESFTDKVLFRGPQTDQGKAVDADAEAQRLSDAKVQGGTVAPAVTPKPPAATGETSPADRKPDDHAEIQKDESGWLDGVLGGIF